MYKNWKAIYQIDDVHFMWALALLDLETDFGRMVAKRFPEYFSDEQQVGPIPWSVISKIAIKKHGEGADSAPVTYDAFKDFDIPLIRFDETGEYPLLSKIESWLKNHSQGDIMEWNGKKIILVEDCWSDGNDWVYFAPAELIASDK